MKYPSSDASKIKDWQQYISLKSYTIPKLTQEITDKPKWVQNLKYPFDMKAHIYVSITKKSFTNKDNKDSFLMKLISCYTISVLVSR